MKSYYLSIFAVLFSLVAVYFAFSGEEVTEGKNGDERIEELLAKVERLEGRLAAGESVRDGAENVGVTKAAGLKAPGGAGAVAEIQARQSELESKLDQYGVIETFAKRKARVEEAYQTALDGERSPKQRLEVLKLLREEGRLDAAVVGSMMDLWEESAGDENVGPYYRWTLMENLRGSTDRRFRDQVLSMLREEPGAKMTGQAISALEPMLPDPAVEDWLLHLSLNGPGAKVQEHAGMVLERGLRK